MTTSTSKGAGFQELRLDINGIDAGLAHGKHWVFLDLVDD